jgi:DNA-binding HxlR family transcriptional regulator
MVCSLYTCKYCKEIFAILIIKEAFKKEDGIRFNELQRIYNKSLDEKIAAPTLIRHLKYLTQKKIVKKTRKGKQNVAYSLNENPLETSIISQEDIDQERKWHEQNAQKFQKMKIESIIPIYLQISMLNDLEQFKTWLQRQLNQRFEKYAFRMEFLNSYYRHYGKELLDAAKERTPLEYKEAIGIVEKMISDLKEVTFEPKS